MELFRFVAIETPSAASTERILRIDLDEDLKASTIAAKLLDPAARDAELKKIPAGSLEFAGKTGALVEKLDAFASWMRKRHKSPLIADAVSEAKSIFTVTVDVLVKDPLFAELRAKLAERYLIDRLDPARNARPQRLATVTRLRTIGLLQYVAAGGAEAERALRIPYTIWIRVDPDRFARAAAAADPIRPSGPGVRDVGLTAIELRDAELDIRRAFANELSAELEKDGDADDDVAVGGRITSSAPDAPRRATRSLAEVVVSLRVDKALLPRLGKQMSRATNKVMERLGAQPDASFDDALDLIAQKRRQLSRGARSFSRFRSTPGGGVVWHAVATASPAPADGAPTTVGAAKLIGQGPLYRVVGKVIGYRTGQLSEVYNIPEGASKERKTRLVERTEEVTGSFKSKVTQQQNETQSDERFSLASETRKLSAFDAQARAGGSFSASYGALSVEGSAEAGVGVRSESTEGLSTAYAKNVITRAATTITDRLEEYRSLSLFREQLTAEKESYTNASGAHISGLYLWVDAVHESKLLEYGRRLMFEVIVPKPGANLLWAPNAVGPDPAAAQPPPEFDVLLDEPLSGSDAAAISRTISRDNYLQLAAKYGARDVPAAPDAVKIVMKALSAGDMATKGTYVTIAKSDESLHVPDGYEASEGWLRFVASRKINKYATWYRVVVGTSQYTFSSNSSASKRTFSHALDISESKSFRGTVPVSIIGTEDRAGVAHVMLRCTPTAETMEAWRASVYSSLLLAYKRALQDYQEAANSSFAQPTSRSPEQLRRIERDEVKRGCLTIMTGQHFERFNALPANQSPDLPPAINLADVKPEGSWIQFFETSIEWENVDFVLYPYFWSDRADWARALTMRLDDPKHEEFLRAGAARVLLPVRQGFESAVLKYFDSPPGSPELWDGLDPDLINLESPLFVAVWQELRDRLRMG